MVKWHQIKWEYLSHHRIRLLSTKKLMFYRECMRSWKKDIITLVGVYRGNTITKKIQENLFKWPVIPCKRTLIELIKFRILNYSEFNWLNAAGYVFMLIGSGTDGKKRKHIRICISYINKLSVLFYCCAGKNQFGFRYFRLPFNFLLDSVSHRRISDKDLTESDFIPFNLIVSANDFRFSNACFGVTGKGI